MTKTSKDIAAALGQYAHDNGRDHITVWNEFLQHSVDTLSFTNEELREGKWFERIKQYDAINPTYSEIFRGLVEAVAVNGHCDIFGGVYEEFFQSKFKASNTGQFFTPESVCDLMADVVGDFEGCAVSDCACGSGRTLIAHAKQAYRNEDTRLKAYVYHGGDTDNTSVMMCALNFAINGMVGMVERRNALTMEFFGGYIVNDIKVPFYNDLIRIKRYDDEKELMQHFNWLKSQKELREYYLMRAYGQNKPTESVEEEESTTEPPTQNNGSNQRKQAEQLSLF